MAGITRNELEQKIIERAWKSESFKQQLMRDPRGALEREVEMRVPEGVNIKILEESPDTLYIVLPMNPDAELTEIELDAVAGGFEDVIEAKPKTRSCLVRPSSSGCSDCF